MDATDVCTFLSARCYPIFCEQGPEHALCAGGVRGASRSCTDQGEGSLACICAVAHGVCRCSGHVLPNVDAAAIAFRALYVSKALTFVSGSALHDPANKWVARRNQEEELFVLSGFQYH